MHCAKDEFPHARYAFYLRAFDARHAVKCGIPGVKIRITVLGAVFPHFCSDKREIWHGELPVPNFTFIGARQCVGPAGRQTHFAPLSKNNTDMAPLQSVSRYTGPQLFELQSVVSRDTVPQLFELQSVVSRDTVSQLFELQSVCQP